MMGFAKGRSTHPTRNLKITNVKIIIIHHLIPETRRFSELRRLIPQVTQRMLTSQLRELEKHGVVHREIYPQVPPKVEYSLTELGKSLEPILGVMHDWGESFINKSDTTI